MALKNAGGLWVRENRSGGKFFSGVIEIDGRKQKFLAFKNDKGDNEKRPDYRIAIADDDEVATKPIDDEDVPF